MSALHQAPDRASTVALSHQIEAPDNYTEGLTKLTAARRTCKLERELLLVSASDLRANEHGERGATMGVSYQLS